MRDVDRSSEDGALQFDPSENPEEAQEIEAVVSLLRSLPDPEPHADLTARVMASVLELEAQAQQRRRVAWLPTSRFATALAASIAMVAVGVGIRQSLQETAPDGELVAFQASGAMPGVGQPTRRDARRGLSVVSAYPGARPPAFFIGPDPSLQGVPQMAVSPVNLFDQHLDAQLNELQLDPQAFFRRLERVQDRERFVQRLAQRAARRGDAAQVGLSVRTVPHRLAQPMVEQFLQASLVQQVSAHR